MSVCEHRTDKHEKQLGHVTASQEEGAVLLLSAGRDVCRASKCCWCLWGVIIITDINNNCFFINSIYHLFCIHVWTSKTLNEWLYLFLLCSFTSPSVRRAPKCSLTARWCLRRPSTQQETSALMGWRFLVGWSAPEGTRTTLHRWEQHAHKYCELQRKLLVWAPAPSSLHVEVSLGKIPNPWWVHEIVSVGRNTLTAQI